MYGGYPGLEPGHQHYEKAALPVPSRQSLVNRRLRLAVPFAKHHKALGYGLIGTVRQ